MEEEAGEVAVEPPLLCAAVERAQAVLGVRLDEVRRGCEERQAVVHLVGALTVELVLPPGVWEGLTNPSLLWNAQLRSSLGPTVAPVALSCES